jgi:hypothetical protein
MTPKLAVDFDYWMMANQDILLSEEFDTRDRPRVVEDGRGKYQRRRRGRRMRTLCLDMQNHPFAFIICTKLPAAFPTSLFLLMQAYLGVGN